MKMEDQYPSYIRFLCHFNDKKSYHEVIQKTFFARGNVIREKVKDLRDEFHAEVEIGVHGASLYREIVERDLALKTFLLTSI
jgi:hypothetical protein